MKGEITEMIGSEWQLGEYKSWEREKKESKESMVMRTNTIVDPRTMMVIDRYTPITSVTMLATWRSKDDTLDA
jgi:hypothetical protein